MSILFLENAPAFEWCNGDLIFQESPTSEGMGSAIKNVTHSADSYQFTHVGMVYIPSGQDEVFVIEATVPVVRMVSLDEYLYPEGEDAIFPLSVVGRLKEEYQPCVPRAIEEALKLLGKAYDYGFVLNNDKYYCSELIYEVLLKANNGQEVFPLNRMTFKNYETGETDENWVSHFKERGLEVPEGEWGINPGAMSTSDVIELLGVFL